ncbi:hypothetical protein E1176_04910 [Fulvivirga sp. RKSG066]|uniref:hypothetical protein n=1 Tax=Fulvivirga aurantia TaxID=2529383 RepID=UPI0012BD67C7|nr:hypothetical protein [Fulvivirga aurantia]MTI20355.1 hypothetical protein [Fulvivirga aurantia]
MKIDITQKGNLYKFYKNNNEDHFLTGKWIGGWFSKVRSEIYDLHHVKLVTIKQGQVNPIWSKKKDTYEFELHKLDLKLTIIVTNRWKGHWSFKFNDDNYDFYRHRGHRRSLYKNSQQIAKYNKRSVNLWEYDKGYIIADNDSNELILICLFLAYDMGEQNDADISVDLGQLAEGVKEYDDSWTPK